MALEVRMEDDGILRIKIFGDFNQEVVDNLKREITPFMEARTHESPLNNIIIPEKVDKISYAARRYFTDLNQNPQSGKMAFVNPSRPMRVLSKFILKATNRDNIGYFENEEQSISWIKSNN